MKSHKTATAINNVTIKVIDEATGCVVQKHSGQNSVTTTLLEGIAHYLQGYGLDNQGALLKNHLPRFISIGTMGLNGYKEENGNIIQLAQQFEIDNEPVDDINTIHFPADIPTRKIVPLLSSIDGGDLLYCESTPTFPIPISIDDPDNSVFKIPKRNYFTYAPGFDADIRAEDRLWELDNNERPVSGIGRPFAQHVADFVVGLDYVEPTTVRIQATSTATNLQVQSTAQFRVDDILRYRLADGTVSTNSHTRVITNIDRNFNTITVASGSWGRALPIGTIIFIQTADGKENYRIQSTNNHACQQDENCTCSCPCCSGHNLESSPVPTPLPLECELVTHQFNRAKIQARRAFYPLSRTDGMNTAETIRSIDVVYTALISLGALQAFRGNNDYIFITECGLWGNRWNGEKYPNSSLIPPLLRNRYKAPADMLAGYRAFPAEWSPQDLTDNMWDTSFAGNQVLVTAAQRYRRRMRQLQRSIPRVGKGQVVQVEWKIQLLALDLTRDLFRQDYTSRPDPEIGMEGRTLY
jgi:hypothetical protein